MHGIILYECDKINRSRVRWNLAVQTNQSVHRNFETNPSVHWNFIEVSFDQKSKCAFGIKLKCSCFD